MQEHQRGPDSTTTDRLTGARGTEYLGTEHPGTEHPAAARPLPPAPGQPPDPAVGAAAGPTSGTAGPGAAATAEADDTLLSPTDADAFSHRWEAVQTGFLDAPRTSVEDANELVADVMQRLAERFAQERERLEHQWSGGEEVSTEDLRLALQRYRSFFHRLLTA